MSVFKGDVSPALVRSLYEKWHQAGGKTALEIKRWLSKQLIIQGGKVLKKKFPVKPKVRDMIHL